MEATRAVARNTLYQAIGKVLGIGFGVISFALMSRYLGPAEFGSYSTAVTFVAIFATLADLGLPVVYLRLLALRTTKTKARIANLHSLRLILTLLILGAGIVAARFFPYDAFVQRGILIMTIGYTAVSLTQYVIAVFQEKLQTARAAFAEVLGRAGMFIVILLAVRYDLGLTTVFWASSIGSVLALVLSLILARRWSRFRLAFDPRIWPSLLRTSLPLMLMSIFSLIYFKVDTLLLSVLKTSDAVGIYSAAYKFMDVFITFPVLFTTLALPFVTRAWAARGNQHVSRIMNKSVRAILLAGLPIALVTFIEADRLVVLFSGEAFSQSGIVLRILSLAVVPLFLGNLATTALIGIGRASLTAWIFGVAAVLGTIAYLSLITNYSYFGAAWVTVVIEGSIAASALIAFTLVTRVRIALIPLAKTLLATVAMATALALTRSLPLLPSLLIAGTVYAGSALVVGAVGWHEIKQILGRTRPSAAV
jgi:O-antigen/teichoic acid export membrane protein